jgi:hypothetical protein
MSNPTYTWTQGSVLGELPYRPTPPPVCDTVDVPLLRKQLEWATAHPEEHYQGDWVQETECGTAYCIAGHTVVDAGYEIHQDPRTDEVLVTTEQGKRHVGDVARELLGLPVDSLCHSSRLFAGGNSLHRLWELASQYTGGQIQIPDELR